MSNQIPNGTRVRCTNPSPFNDREGVIYSSQEVETYPDFSHIYLIVWEGDSGPAGGYWSEGAFEVIDEAQESEIEALKRRIEVLEAATDFAGTVFEHYAGLHFAKGPNGLFKAMTNMGFAAVMSNALKADS